MPDIPNTNAPAQLLLSIGNGSNASYWSPAIQGWSTHTTPSVTATTNAYPTGPNVVLASVNVSGFTNYFVTYSMSQNNSAASTTATIIAQIVDAVGLQLHAAQLGIFTSSTHNAWAGSGIVTSTNYGQNPFTLTLAAYTSSGTCPLGYATLTVIGLN